MIRISTIFIAICMVLVAASLGLILYSVAGLSGMESAIVALTALTFLILYNAVSMRLRDRTDVGGQIADLSRGTADLARQVAEFGRRLAAVEGYLHLFAKCHCALVDEDVVHDGKQPRTQITSRRPQPALFPRPRQRLLHEVIGPVRVPGQHARIAAQPRNGREQIGLG